MKKDSIDKIGKVLVSLFVVFLLILTIFDVLGFIKEHLKVVGEFTLVFLIIFCAYICLCRKELVAMFKESKLEKEEMKKRQDIKKEKEEKENMKNFLQQERELRFYNKPAALSDDENKKLWKFNVDYDFYLRNKYNIQSIKSASYSPEELYTLLFINKDILPLEIYVEDKILDLGVMVDDMKGFVVKNENYLSDYLREEIPEQPAKKKTSSKVKKLRRERKLREQARKDGTIIKNGKRYQPKNYDFLAKEWIASNMGYINKLLQDAIQKNPTGNKYEVIIPDTKLPEDKETWTLIGKKLKEEDEISRYVVSANNIKLVVSSN